MAEIPTFSVAVVGLGMIGSAACRYVACTSVDSKVVGIGPAEPEEWSKHRGVFGSYYDQGRLTRIVDVDTVWSKLAARSMARYAGLEEESGVKFHFPVGCLRVSPFYGKPQCSLQKAFQVGNANGAEVELIQGGEELRRRFPYFQFGEGDVAVLERGGAGYVDPRQMVQAQLAVAARHGACIVRESVSKIVAGNGGMEVCTEEGNRFVAQKVLVCADAYTSCLVESVAGGKNLALNTHKVSVLLAEVGEEEQKRLRDMPSVIWRLDSHHYLHSVYACPPVLYPDGKVCLKLGGTVWGRQFLSGGRAEIAEWFQGSEQDAETQALHQVLLSLIPGFQACHLLKKPCIVSYTAHNYPYIDAVDGKPASDAQVFVATGGCGAAAKSSDEIGRIAALLVTSGQWSYDLDSSLFKAAWT